MDQMKLQLSDNLVFLHYLVCRAVRTSVCVHLLLVVLLLTQNRFQLVSCFMKRLKVQLCIFHPQHIATTFCRDGKNKCLHAAEPFYVLLQGLCLLLAIPPTM